MIILDPLSGDEDPRLYVPLGTGERALAQISTSLRNGRSRVLLNGPSGIGKTLLLSVLAERERASYSRVRFSHSLHLEPDEVSGWLLRLLSGKSCPAGPAADAALAEVLSNLCDERTLLLVDEIHRTPEASVRKLVELARSGSATLTVVAAGADGRDLRAVTATFAPDDVVALPWALPESEIEQLYDAILSHPGLSPRLRVRMASVARAEILGAAGGLPRLLKDDLVRRDQQGLTAGRRLPPPVKPAARIEKAPAEPVKRAIAPRKVGAGVVVIGTAARRRLAEFFATLAQALRRIGSRLASPALGASRAARSGVGSAASSAARAARAAGSASRAALNAAHDAATTGMTRLRAGVASSVTTGGAVLQRASSGVTAATHRLDAAVRRGSADLSRSAGEATGRARSQLARARRGSAVVIASTGRAVMRAARLTALPAIALVAAVLFLTVSSGPDPEEDLRENPAVAAAPPGQPSPEAAVASAATPVDLQVNARPWARVRIDGVDLGATPLTWRVAPGSYRLEAEFPDGRTIERRIEVGPQQRFVSLP